MKTVALTCKPIRDDIEKAVKLLSDNKDLKINGLYASDFEALKNEDNDLFVKVSELIKEDRWCPFVGTYSHVSELSPTALIKNCLYSVRFFEENFGKTYKVFHGTKICNNSLPQIVYSSLFDASFLESEKSNRWICSDDGHRTLSFCVETADVNCYGALANEEAEFVSIEEYGVSLFSTELNIDTLLLPAPYGNIGETEQKLLKAEKQSVLENRDCTSEIRSAWISLFAGDTDTSEKAADAISKCASANMNDFISLSEKGVDISELKFAEDKSGDVIIRVRETEGKEKGAYIMCDKMNAGFRFEIMPHEIQTFRIKSDGSGIVTEIYICE